MQSGSIKLHHGSWTLLYWDTRIQNGAPTRVKARAFLAKKSEDYPTERSVRDLADDILRPINRKQVQPESSLLLTEFIEQRYFPMMQPELKPSTFKGYKKDIYEPHLKARLKHSGLRVREFRTVHGQRLLREIDGVSHTTLLHIKSFLSGVFAFAKREGVLDGVNPMQDVSVKGRPTKFRGVAYSLEDVFCMLEHIETAADAAEQVREREHLDAYEIITLLSLTGLRTGECQGLKWVDVNEQNLTLNISRSVWRTHVGTTKSAASEDVIPMIPLLLEMLGRRRARLKPEPDDYVFAGFKRLRRYGKKRAPLNLHNLENRVIKPALATNWLNDEVLVKWVGYHGFRRGLATNLLTLGVEPIIVAAIMRHSDVRTTLEHYNITREADKIAAMQRLEEKVRSMDKWESRAPAMEPTNA